MNTSIQSHTFSVDQFCKAHNISRAKFYQMLKEGTAPRIMKIGKRTLISNESAQKWRAHIEAISNVGSN